MTTASLGAAPMMTAMAARVTSPILVGRARERRLLLSAVERAAAGVPTMVLIGGEAGIGKTRLLADVVETARDGGWLVLRGSCVQLGDGEGLPFGPIAEALRTVRRDLGPGGLDELMDPATSELASLVPDLGVASEDPTIATRPDWAQTRVFEGLATFLGRLSGRAPVLLTIEDLHWADRSTRDVLAFLARSLGEGRVAVIATYRDDELHRRHPLRPWLAEMERDADVVRVDLTRLTAADVEHQVEGILGEAAAPGDLEDVVRRSGGNPFFVEELLAAVQGGAGDQLPDSLRDLLLVRVHGLSAVAADILGQAAVAGVAVEHDLLVETGGRDERALSVGLREAVEAQLLVTVDPTGYAFRHALLQEAVYDDLLPSDRRAWHARFARALRERPVPDGALGASQLAALAHHASAAHDLPLALRASVDGARASARVWALAESVDAYARALDLWDAVPPDDRPSDVMPSDLLYRMALSLIGIGQLRRALDVADEAIRRYPPDGEPLRLASFYERKARALWLCGELTRALDTLDRAVDLTRGRPGTTESARVLASLAGTLVLKDQTARAIEIGREAVAAARAVDAPHIEAYALCGLGVALVNRGDCAEGLEHLRTSLAMAHRLRLGAIDFHRVYANLSTGLQICGDLEASVAVALEGVEWAKGHGLWQLQGAFLEGNAAQTLAELGRWAEARALLDQRSRPIIEGVADLNHALVAAPLLLRSGETEAARSTIARAYERLDGLGDAQFTGPISATAVELAIGDGRLDDALEIADTALRRMADTEETGARYRAEILAQAIDVDARLARIAAAVRDEAANAARRADAERRVEAIRAVTAGPIGPLDGFGGETLAHAAMGEASWTDLAIGPDPTGWHAAAERWRALRRPYPLAVCLTRLAESTLAARGPRPTASAALDEAYAIARSLGAAPLAAWCESLARMGRLPLEAPTPARGSEAIDPSDGGTGDPATRVTFGLTERELDVVRLLVQGHSNRRIGETLFMSESTAGVHVSNIIGKLGVANRVEAAALAVRSGLVD